MTDTTEKMTWSEWNRVICGQTAVETWTCEQWLNQRPNLNIILVGRVRYRADRKAKVTLAELAADHWVKAHHLDF